MSTFNMLDVMTFSVLFLSCITGVTAAADILPGRRVENLPAGQGMNINSRTIRLSFATQHPIN